MKWLKLISLGVLIWAATLLWAEVNIVLASPLMLGLVIGLVAILPAYFLGRYVEHTRTQLKLKLSPSVDTTTRLMPGLAAQRYHRHHSNPTLPMPALRPRTLHSQRTRPMSVG